MKPIYIVAALFLLFVTSCLPTPETIPTPTTEPGEFLDENLEAAIKYALGKKAEGAVTSAELAGLTALRAPMRGITDLSGI